MTISNRGHQLFGLGCILVMVWGLLCAALVQPSAVGWLFYGSGLLALWWMVVSLLYAPAREFWAAWEACKSNLQLRARAYYRTWETEVSPPDLTLAVMPEDDDEKQSEGDSDDDEKRP